jgi:predicted PurR-regulated permease PerM
LLVIPAYFLIRVLVIQITNVAKIENIEKIYSFLKEIKVPSEVLDYVPVLTEKISSYSLSFTYSIIKYIPNLILNLIITIFLTFYFLSDWDNLNKEIKNIIPFKNKEKIIKDFSDTAHNIVFGSLLIAIIEFVISLIGFYLIGINYFIILSCLVAITALIPLIGPGFVWVPLAIIKAIQGNYLAAFLVVILGLILGLGVDFFLR